MNTQQYPPQQHPAQTMPQQPPQPMQPMQPATQKRKNPLGIASVVMCVFGILAFIGLAVLWHLLQKVNSNSTSAQHSLEHIMRNLSSINFFVTFGLGLILGVIGLFLKGRRKLGAILGIILNIAGAPAGFILFIYVGFALAYTF